MSLPTIVTEAGRRAEAAGFTLSCEPDVGALLSCLAAAVPEQGRILELGTGAGVGLAWLVHGLGDRHDVEVVTVDIDETLQTQTRASVWPAYVHFTVGDGASLVTTLGLFDLIFADAPGGKTIGLDGTIEALRPGGTVVVDDMDLDRHHDDSLRRLLGAVRRDLLDDDRLASCELPYSSGVMTAVRRRSQPG